jgi:hypothetical protein
VENHIAAILYEKHKLLEEELKSSLPDIIRNSIAELVRTWQDTASSPLAEHGDDDRTKNRSSQPTLEDNQEAAPANTERNDISQFYEGPPASGLEAPDLIPKQGFESGYYDQDESVFLESGYGSHQLYRCYCSRLSDDVFPLSDEGVVLNGSRPSDSSEYVAFPSGQMQAAIPTSENNDGKGKGRQDGTADLNTRFCSRCFGVL